NMIVNNGNKMIVIGLVVTVIVIGIGILLAVITANAIAKPLSLVKNRMNEIAKGDLSKEPLEMKSKDEIGNLIDATNEMHQYTSNLLQKIRKVANTVGTHSEQLTHSAKDVSIGADIVASTMDELATGTESQANHATELSATMSTFSKKVQETNENGETIEETSKSVLEMTKDGSELMSTSTEQMAMIDDIVHIAVQKVEGLNTHTQEISKLISVIQDIADQTNLLALNAAI